jgi:hypothetical protein
MAEGRRATNGRPDTAAHAAVIEEQHVDAACGIHQWQHVVLQFKCLGITWGEFTRGVLVRLRTRQECDGGQN